MKKQWLILHKASIYRVGVCGASEGWSKTMSPGERTLTVSSENSRFQCVVGISLTMPQTVSVVLIKSRSWHDGNSGKPIPTLKSYRVKEEWAESIRLDTENLHLTEGGEEEGKKPIICQIYKQGCMPDYSSTESKHKLFSRSTSK